MAEDGFHLFPWFTQILSQLPPEWQAHFGARLAERQRQFAGHALNWGNRKLDAARAKQQEAGYLLQLADRVDDPYIRTELQRLSGHMLAEANEKVRRAEEMQTRAGQLLAAANNFLQQ